MRFFSRFQRAYTIVEILVAGFIFTVLMTVSGTSLFFLLQAREATIITNNLYEESRFVMERIVREARVNTIDYYEYFGINHRGIDPAADEYGSLANPGEYEMRFYFIPNYPGASGENNPSSGSFSWKQEDRQLDTDVGKFDTGGNDVADTIEDYKKRALIPDGETIESSGNFYRQEELILLSPDGLEKTIIKVVEDTATVAGETLRRLAMAKMSLVDGNGDVDTTPDHWEPQADYENGGDLQFVYITPPELVVAENDGFYVYIAPLDDPKKAFAQFGSGNEIPNVQPHVTIVLNTTVSQHRARAMRGPAPTLSLQTTVSSRVYNEVVFPRP